MNKVESNLVFRLMAMSYTFHDFFQPRVNTLRKVGIQSGFRILDYGCGTGSYVLVLK